MRVRIRRPPALNRCDCFCLVYVTTNREGTSMRRRSFMHLVASGVAFLPFAFQAVAAPAFKFQVRSSMTILRSTLSMAPRLKAPWR